MVQMDEMTVLVFKERAGCEGGGKGILITENKSFTLSTLVDEAICYEAEMKVESIGHDLRSTQFSKGGCCDTLTANDYKEPPVVCYGISGFNSGAMLSDNPESGIYEAKTSRTLDLNGGNPACNQGGIMVVEPKVKGALCANSHPGSYTGQDAFNNMLPVIKTDKPERKYILRRLTPTECARLQGFPDWWTDGANGSDSNIYKMWGNGIALPCAADVIGRLAKELEKET